jgi:hypothetical protein
MKKNAVGYLTLYIQKDSPGKDKESNWLPANFFGGSGRGYGRLLPRSLRFTEVHFDRT